MLSEHIFVNEGEKLPTEIKEVYLRIRCPVCGAEKIIWSSYIEDYTNSDVHDPLCDYYICNCCGAPTNLMKQGVPVFVDGNEGRLVADGSYIYVVLDNKVGQWIADGKAYIEKSNVEVIRIA